MGIGANPAEIIKHKLVCPSLKPPPRSVIMASEVVLGVFTMMTIEICAAPNDVPLPEHETPWKMEMLPKAYAVDLPC